LALRHDIEYVGAMLLFKSLELTPLPVAKRLAASYAKILDRAVPRLRRVGRKNLSMALPEKSAGEREAILDGTFRSIGRVLLAIARFPGINRETVGKWIRYKGYEHFEEALKRGKGVLFATGHLGNWELSAYSHAIMSAPMGVVVRPLDNPRLDAFIERRRGISGNHLIGKRDFARPILQALRRNEAVGILVDQNVVPENGAFVDFFGKLACSGTTFAKIGARSGAAVIPGFAFWSDEEQRHILHFYPEVTMTGDLEWDTAAIQKAVENAIREHPDQWLWIHRRWKTRPPGEASFY
jgi:Kdo2-lipid IVA lauroyltransferase/acyltransferase